MTRRAWWQRVWQLPYICDLSYAMRCLHAYYASVFSSCHDLKSIQVYRNIRHVIFPNFVLRSVVSHTLAQPRTHEVCYWPEIAGTHKRSMHDFSKRCPYTGWPWSLYRQRIQVSEHAFHRVWAKLHIQAVIALGIRLRHDAAQHKI